MKNQYLKRFAGRPRVQADFQSVSLPVIVASLGWQNWLISFLLLPAWSAQAQINQTDLSRCKALRDDALRLACYDQVVVEKTDSTLLQSSEIQANQSKPGIDALPDLAPLPPAKPNALFTLDPHSKTVSTASFLTRMWELAPEEEDPTFTFKSHRPIYLLPVFYSTSTNNVPFRSTLGEVQGLDGGLQRSEVKFQVSFKTKVIKSLFPGNGDLWLGYTQQSYWQFYNRKNSAPFRETNYEPEAMLVFKTDYRLLGWDARMLNIGLAHQSNGRGGDLSRSWNRAYVQLGLEKGAYSLFIKPWWRLPEKSGDDDNPNIVDYVGRGEVLGVYQRNGQQYTVTWRNNFRPTNNRGSLQFSWAFPIENRLKGYVQVFHGYGQNLIDYDYKQTSVGFGIVITE